MTMRSIYALRQAFRKAIRKEQLQERFQHERVLLMDVNPEEAVQTIERLLENLQTWLAEENMKEVARVLTHMRNIAGQFMILDFLMRKVSISALKWMARNGKNCDSVSWIEVFLELLNEDDEMVREESSALLLTNCEKYRLKKHIIIQQFPIKYLNDGNWKVAMHMLAAFEELLEMAQFQKQVIYLINNQHFLMIFVSLLEDEDRMQIRTYQEKIVEASLLLVYFISMCEKINQRPEIQLLHQLVKPLLMLRLKKGDDSIQVFTMLRVLSISQAQFSCQELDEIESIFFAELAKQNPSYFQLLNALIYQHDYIISAYSFEAITVELFKCNERKDPNSECLRKWLALIFHKSLQLIKQSAEDQDYLKTIESLVKSQALMENLSLILEEARQSSEALFITLTQSLKTICQILDFSEQMMRMLALLQRYEEWNSLQIP